VLERLRGTDAAVRAWIGAGTLALLVAFPLVAASPGNDLDVANVFRSGRSMARHLSYLPSRPPGAPVHELIVGVLDLLGGPVLTNLASVAAAAWLLYGLHELMRETGHGRSAALAVALVAANPWFVIAATSTADYVFALAFVIAAARAVRAGRSVEAGLLAAAAMGCRIGSAALIGAVLVAELTESRLPVPAAGMVTGETQEPAEEAASTAAPPSTAARRVAITAAVTAAATVVIFIPSFLSAGGLSFADNDFSTSSVAVQLGRALAKDLILLGPIASLVALLALPALVRTLRAWRLSWPVRFATIGFALSQLLFVRFPWKMPHLLPCLLCLAILLAVVLAERPRLVVALVVLQLLFCVVRVDVVQPDDPNQASGGRIAFSTGWGPVVRDWQCRREHSEAYRGRQKVEVEQAWDCAKPFGG
jgi:hypothetical protein